MESFYKKLKSPYILWGSFFAGLLCIFIFGYFDQARPSHSPTPLEIQFVYSLEAFQNILMLWGDQGVQAFKNILYVDYFFPIAYSFFLSSLIGIQKAQLPFLLLPFLAAILDWVENSFHLILLNNVVLSDSPVILSAAKDLFSYLVFLATFCALIKWVLVFISLIYIMYRYLKKFV
ncbi:MAG: hypothetical protein HYW47_05005 [Deltaproteobacteria bacterium]|nr:hypothetical protein [Deltaproteobacteria bacterium]